MSDRVGLCRLVPVGRSESRNQSMTTASLTAQRRVRVSCGCRLRKWRSMPGTASRSASSLAQIVTGRVFIGDPTPHTNVQRILRLCTRNGSAPTCIKRLDSIVLRCWLGLSTRYHYNISIPRFSALPKLFLPLFLPFEVSMVPNCQRLTDCAESLFW